MTKMVPFRRRHGASTPCRAAFLMLCVLAAGCGKSLPPNQQPPGNREAVGQTQDNPPGEELRIELVEASGDQPAMFVVHGVDAAAAEKQLQVAVATGQNSTAGGTPMLGEVQAAESELRFIPEFPLTPGLRYRVDVTIDGARFDKTFEVPAVEIEPTTVVTQVYPSTAVVPENLLKFYFHFSAPMSRGESYKHIQLLDQSGEPVELPFLEIGEELWDRDQQRLTVLFDPGRIKRELLPRELLGPALQAGRRYTLIVQSTWPDARGAPLAAEFRKSFRVGPADEVSPDVRTWKLTAPPAESRRPLIVVSPESLDQALFERLLHVVDAAGDAVPGLATVSEIETRWEFVPADRWAAGQYKLVVNTVLEDRAGNSIARPFEVDLFEKIDKQIEQQTIELPFAVQP